MEIVRPTYARVISFILSICVICIPSTYAGDCNTNGIEDECEFSCIGECDVEGCGQGTDCNGNSIPDECETNGLYIGTQGGLAGGGGGKVFRYAGGTNWDIPAPVSPV